MKRFEEVTYYRDVEEEGGQTYGVGDYICITLSDSESGAVVFIGGDYYHDKGTEKLEGFYKGLSYAGVEYEVVCRDAKHE
jgi:hypothetical protein